MKQSFLLTRHSSASRSLAVFAIGTGFASVVIVLLYALGQDAVAAVRDRAMSNSPVAGLISDIGIILVSLAGVVALGRSWFLSSLPLALLGLFCCLFALDDALQLHERLGNLEVMVFAFYGLFFLTILGLYSKSTGTLTWPIVFTLAAFATSIIVDVFWGALITPSGGATPTAGFAYRLGYILEDIPKFGGIFVLASFALGEAVVQDHQHRG